LDGWDERPVGEDPGSTLLDARMAPNWILHCRSHVGAQHGIGVATLLRLSAEIKAILQSTKTFGGQRRAHALLVPTRRPSSNGVLRDAECRFDWAVCQTGV